jgi:pilus assembly protein Flp/PilA
MFDKVKKFLADETGPTAVEYAVMLALIVVVCIGAVNNMANGTASSFNNSAAQIASAFGGS